MELIQCPNCKEVQLFDDVFSWLPDFEGHPTVEELKCKSCLCSNFEIEFEDGTTNDVFELNDFIMVNEEDLTKKDKERILTRIAEIDEFRNRKIVCSSDLPF